MKKILVVTLSNIGDVILTTPVMTALAQQYPNATITVVSGPKAASLLEGSAKIARVVVYDKKAGLLSKVRFLQALRRDTYDMVVDLRHTMIPYLVKAVRRSPAVRQFRDLSFRSRHLEVLEKTGVTVPGSLEPFDFFSRADESSARDKLKQRGIFSDRDWIVISPVAASGLKTWPMDRFRTVVRRLLAESDRPILLVGQASERAALEPLIWLNSTRIFNLAGQTTLRELAWIVSRAALLLANDSAVMHLGYELDRPVVAVFGPTHHEKYGRTGDHFRVVRAAADCSPCEQPVCRFARQHCFEDLGPEKVIAACKELLGEPVASR